MWEDKVDEKMNRRQSGFTLLEMIIAIAIFSVLSLSAFSAMRHMLLSDEILSRRTDRLNELNLTFSQIEQDFYNMIPKMARSSYGKEVEAALLAIPSRAEDKDAIWFTRNSWFNPGLLLARSELQRVGYRLEDGHLIREYFTFVDRVPNADPKKRILLTNIESLRFRYLSQNQWIHEWQFRDKLPDAIEITLKSTQDGELTRRFILIPTLAIAD